MADPMPGGPAPLIRDMRAEDASTCAAMACDSAIGARYGFQAEKLAAQFIAAIEGGRQDLFVAEGPGDAGSPDAGNGEGPDSGIGGAAADVGDATCAPPDQPAILGFAWVDPRGAFSSAPYLRLIAVAPGGRGAGVGSALLAAFEERTAGVGRDWCLLVSDFNAGAISFYARHGYERVGALPDFAMPGVTEIIMAKRRRPDGRL